MTTERSELIDLANGFAECLNRHDAEALRGLLDDNYINHNPFVSDVPGPDSAVGFFTDWLVAFPDAQVICEDALASGPHSRARSSVGSPTWERSRTRSSATHRLVSGSLCAALTSGESATAGSRSTGTSSTRRTGSPNSKAPILNHGPGRPPRRTHAARYDNEPSSITIAFRSASPVQPSTCLGARWWCRTERLDADTGRLGDVDRFSSALKVSGLGWRIGAIEVPPRVGLSGLLPVSVREKFSDGCRDEQQRHEAEYHHDGNQGVRPVVPLVRCSLGSASPQVESPCPLARSLVVTTASLICSSRMSNKVSGFFAETPGCAARSLR